MKNRDLNKIQHREEDQHFCLDAKHLLCPEPIMMLHQKIRTLSTGDVLKFSATDPSTQRDVEKFCTFLGHPLLKKEVVKLDDLVVFIFWIKKK